MAIGYRCYRPKLADFGLTTKDSSVFYSAQWTKWPRFHYVFVLYRILVALYVLGIFIMVLVHDVRLRGGQSFVYLTMLAFIVVFIYLMVAGFVAWLDGIILRARNHEVMAIRHKIQWFFFNVTIDTNLIVTILYWSFLYSPEQNPPSFRNFNVHATPAIITTLDLFLTAIPVRFLHFIYPLGFAISYIVMTLIFWAAGGRTPSGPIYPFLDYDDDPGLAAGGICGAIALGFVVHCAFWCIYKFRVWVWTKCRGDQISDELSIIDTPM
ncbi:protein rolling stone-like [Acanthaster planci]|uniref:Protein rolling stone-like n=1 Tax=Acanthaster planci TaxID=133434 RepID=A0A8B7ZZ85_ACAPL|nr:protein rolling stone-like [Acanthaster planci]